MGQKIGKSSSKNNRRALMEERWQVLRQSAEILTKITDHVNEEEAYLLNYDLPKIANKVDKWLDIESTKFARVKNTVNIFKQREPAFLEKAFLELNDEMIRKTQEDYEVVYKDLDKLAERLDELAEKQRRVHEKVLNLEEVGFQGVRKSQKKLASLRAKMLKNSQKCAKMLEKHKRLKLEFEKKVYDIDQGNMELCKKKVQQIIRDFQRKPMPSIC